MRSESRSYFRGLAASTLTAGFVALPGTITMPRSTKLTDDAHCAVVFVTVLVTLSGVVLGGVGSAFDRPLR